MTYDHSSTHAMVAIPAAALGLYLVAVPLELPRASATAPDESCAVLGETPAQLRDIRTLEACCSLDPTSPDLLGDLALAYESIGLPDQAVAAYRRALDIDPGHAELRLRLGRLLLTRGSFDEARRQALAALRVQPNRAAAVELRDAALEGKPEASR